MSRSPKALEAQRGGRWNNVFYEAYNEIGSRVTQVGVVGGPKDLARGRTKFIEEALKDLSPGLKDDVMQVLNAWEGDPSEAKLANLVGREKAKRLVQSFGVK